MDTAIGLRLRNPGGKALKAGLVGAVVVTADLAMAPDHWIVGVRTLLPLAGLVALLILAGADRASLGLRLRPIQGWGWWFWGILTIGGIVGMVAMVLFFAGRRAGFAIEVPMLSPERVGHWFQVGCISAPLIEEATYRLVLCVAAAAVFGFWPTVVLSGVVFGYLHVRYGCAGPDNLIAGFFLGWAYLRSGCILIPVLMHSLGNLCVLLLELFVWARQVGAA